MRVLFAWEVGHNFGHATQIALIARALKKQRADVWMALKSPEAGQTFIKDFPGRILQAPYHPIVPGKSGQPLTYAEGLLPCGYDSADTLAAQIGAWRALFSLVKPDVLIAQAAPTALLAAKGLKFKRMTFGRGFDLPPLDTPMPPLRYWETPDKAKIKQREAEILGIVNAALKKLDMKPLKSFSQAIEPDREFLCTFKELDHYPARDKTEYYGPLFTDGSGAKIDWNKKAKKRIFAYISAGPPQFMACIEALRQLPPGHDVIIACRGLPAGLIKKLETPFLRIIPGPVQLDRLLGKCDLAITNAGSGLCNGLALAGVPALMLPLHIEQLMSARAFGRAGMGISLIGNIKPQDVASKIMHVLTEKKYRDNAKAFATRYKAFSPAKSAKKIADEIMG